MVCVLCWIVVCDSGTLLISCCWGIRKVCAGMSIMLWTRYLDSVGKNFRQLTTAEKLNCPWKLVRWEGGWIRSAAKLAVSSFQCDINYAFNSVLCRIYRVKHDLLSCICEYTGQSDILDEISNRHLRFVTQSLCSPNLLVRYVASVGY